MSNILVIQLISLIPLFILGVDYGRWVFYWTVSSLAFILLVKDENSVYIPLIVKRISRKLNNSITFSKGQVILLSLILGFPVVFIWSTLYGYTYTSALVYVLKIITEIIICIK